MQFAADIGCYTVYVFTILRMNYTVNIWVGQYSFVVNRKATILIHSKYLPFATMVIQKIVD